MIICPVCERKCLSKLHYSHHLKMASINCIEHKKFVEKLHKKIANDIKNKSIVDIANEINLGYNWVRSRLKLFYSSKQINVFEASRREKKFKNNTQCICVICHKPFLSHDKIPKKTCSEECKIINKKRVIDERSKKSRGKSLEELYGQERATEIRRRRLERTLQTNLRLNRHRLYCKCGKSRNFDKNIVEYVCRNCKTDLDLSKYTLSCDNCGRIIKRYKREVQEAIYTVKHVDGPVFFCNKKCYSEFYKSHPERYLEQRQQAGFASVKSFRERDKFEYSGIHFSSATEMKCAQYIEKELNVVLVERKNCHVIIGNIEVDFLINNIVIEYHQCHRETELSLKERIKIWRESNYKNKFRYEYRTLKEYYLCRKKKLPEEYKLFVVEREKDFHKIKDFVKF